MSPGGGELPAMPQGYLMTPRQLEASARKLFGFDFPWQRPLARALDIDPRLMRRWVAQDRPIPSWVPERLGEIARERRVSLDALVAYIDSRALEGGQQAEDNSG